MPTCRTRGFVGAGVLAAGIQARHQQPDGCRASPSLAGDIAFEEVSFRYEEDEPVIRNLSFYIPYGRGRPGWTAAAGKRPS